MYAFRFWDTKYHQEHLLSVYLAIEKCMHLDSDTSPWYQNLNQLDNLIPTHLWEIVIHT